MKKIVCFGEILWDGLPTGKILGGAPLNLALRLFSLGTDAQIISKIGNDQLGEEILDELSQRGFPTNYVQTDQVHPSGYVKVAINDKGSATYEILEPVAWDKIEANEENIELVKNTDALIFGSLVIRDPESRSALLNLLPYAKMKILDVNLRAPHYDYESLMQLVEVADIIKLNDDELYEISEYLGSPYHSLEQNMVFLSEKTNTAEVCVTKGKHGAVFYKEKKFYYNSGYKVDVVDTIGAGDSFLATFLHYYLNDTDVTEALQYACAMGALVSGQTGPTPDIATEKFLNFVNKKEIVL